MSNYLNVTSEVKHDTKQQETKQLESKKQETKPITNTRDSINNPVNTHTAVVENYTNNKELDDNHQLVNRLDEIFNKYKNIFDSDDANDFETIVETLKANLEFS
jgi:hypothetical protein